MLSPLAAAPPPPLLPSFWSPPTHPPHLRRSIVKCCGPVGAVNQDARGRGCLPRESAHAPSSPLGWAHPPSPLMHEPRRRSIAKRKGAKGCDLHFLALGWCGSIHARQDEGVVEVWSLSLWRMWTSAVTTLPHLTTLWDKKKSFQHFNWLDDRSYENGLSLSCATFAALLDVQCPRWFAR